MWLKQKLKIWVRARSTWLKTVISHRHSETEQKIWLECWMNSFERRTSLSAVGGQGHFENGLYSSTHTKNKPPGVVPSDSKHSVNSFGIRLHYPASYFVRKFSVNLQNFAEILLSSKSMFLHTYSCDCTARTTNSAAWTSHKWQETRHAFLWRFLQREYDRRSCTISIGPPCRAFPYERNSVVVHRYLKLHEASNSSFPSGVPSIEDDNIFVLFVRTPRCSTIRIT